MAVDTLIGGLRGWAQTSVGPHAIGDLRSRDLAETVRLGSMKPERAKRLQARLFVLGLPYADTGCITGPSSDTQETTRPVPQWPLQGQRRASPRPEMRSRS